MRSSLRPRERRNVRAYLVREAGEWILLVIGMAVLETWVRIPRLVWILVPFGKAASGVLFYGLLRRGTPSRAAQTAAAALVGRAACAKTPLRPEGHVALGGELWSARSADGRVLPAGSWVIVRRVEGNCLVVEALRGPDAAAG